VASGCSHHGTSAHHHHHHSSASIQKLWWVILLVAGYCILEVVGGFWTGSLALLADAGHMVSDLTSLLVSLGAAWLVTRKAGRQQTFGFHRAEILAALFNGAFLIVVAVGIVYEAWERFSAPQPILGGAMLLIALGGLLVNLISLSILHGARDHNLNLRGAWLHVVGDTLGSVAVIVAALLVWGWGWNWADPLASVLACLLILFSAWNLMADAVRVLMEQAPRHLDVCQVRTAIQNAPGVVDVHCLHLWTIASQITALSAHIVIDDRMRSEDVLKHLQSLLRREYSIHHVTLQIEASSSTLCPDRNDGDCLMI